MATLQQAVREFGTFSSDVSSICDETITCFREIKQTLKESGEDILSTTALQDVQGILRKKPAVIFIGDRNCGKSSLLNELLGGSYLPVHENPCTSRIVRIVYAEENYVDLITRNGSVIRDPASDVRSFRQNLKRCAVLADEDKQNEEKLTCTVRVGLNHELLSSGVELIDSPGRNETDELDEILDAFLKEGTVPLIVYIIDGGLGLRLTDVKTINLIQEKFPQVSLMFVCNKVDTTAKARQMDCDSDDEVEDPFNKGAAVFDKLKDAKLIPTEASIQTYPYFHAVSAKAHREGRRGKKPEAKANPENLKAAASFQRFEQCIKERLEVAVKQETKRAVNKLLVLQESFVNGVSMAHASEMMATQSFQTERIPDIFDDIMRAEAAFKDALATLAANQKGIQSLIENSLHNLEKHFTQIAEEYEIAAVDNIQEDIGKSMVEMGSPGIALEMMITMNLDSEATVFARFIEDMKETILSETFNALKDPLARTMTEPVASASENIMSLLEKLQHPIAAQIFQEIYEIDFAEMKDHSKEMLLFVLEKLLDSIKEIGIVTFRKEISGPVSKVFPPGQGAEYAGHDVRDKNNRIEVVRTILSSIDPCKVSQALMEECNAKFDQMHRSFQAALAGLQQFIEGLASESDSSRLNELRDVHTPKVRLLAVRSYALQFLMMKGPLEVGEVVPCAQIYECVSPRWYHDGKATAVKVVEKKTVGSETWNRTGIDLINTWDIFTRRGRAHPNLLYVLGWLMPREGVLQVVMEKASTDLLTALRRGMSPRRRLKVAAGAALGLKAMHDVGYVYQDLKPENILLMEDGTAKINMAAPERPFEETRLGCPFHVSDEMYRNYGTGPAHESYDIYAFGMLLWVMCEGSGAARPQSYKTRQTNAAMQTAVQNGVIPERPPEVTDDCWLLMISCWRDRRRISIDEIIVLVNKLQH